MSLDTPDWLARHAYETAKANGNLSLPPSLPYATRREAVSNLRLAALLIESATPATDTPHPYIIRSNADGEAVDRDGRGWGE